MPLLKQQVTYLVCLVCVYMYVDPPYTPPMSPSRTKLDSQLTNQSKSSISRHNKNHMANELMSMHYSSHNKTTCCRSMTQCWRSISCYCCSSSFKIAGAYKLNRTIVLSSHSFLLKHTLHVVQPDITGCYPILISPRPDILLYDLFPLRNPFTAVLCDKITLMMEFTL